jgi:oxygen-dependent protoporphyrinogen oxidase
LIDTVVIGAGLSGLTRADALTRSGQDVLLLEDSGRAGGVVSSEMRDGFLLEKGPNTVRPTAALWQLVVGLDLESEALLADPREPRFIDFRGSLQPVPMSLKSFFSTPLLSWRGKLRLLAEFSVLPSRERVESVASFFQRRLGPEVAERFVEPFISGVFAGDAWQLDVAQCFPKLARWERDFSSLTFGALVERWRASGPRPVRGLLTFREGLETLPRAIATRLGDRLRLGTRVEALRSSKDSWTVCTAKEEISARRVVLATPAREAALLVGSFAPDASAALHAIPHPPLVVLHLAWPIDAFPSPPRGFGHLVVPQPERRILGAIYSSSLFPDRAPSGRFLATIFLGGTRDPAAVDLPGPELASIVEDDLAVLHPTSPFEIVRITRYARALPQYDLEHGSRIETLQRTEREWPGLTFLGNYRGGVSVGDVVANATKIAPG